MRIAAGLGLAAIVAMGVVGAAGAAVSVPDGDWWTINRDPAATRYSPLKEINRSNVSKLAVKWAFTTHGDVSATPTVA